MVPLLVERGNEPKVIKKANHFVCFKFGDVQLLDSSNFLRRTTSLDSFMKAYKTSETKNYFPYECFADAEKLNNTQLPPNETFFSKLRNEVPLKKVYSEFRGLIDGGLTSKEALSELEVRQTAATGQENCQYLTVCGNKKTCVP